MPPSSRAQIALRLRRERAACAATAGRQMHLIYSWSLASGAGIAVNLACGDQHRRADFQARPLHGRHAHFEADACVASGLCDEADDASMRECRWMLGNGEYGTRCELG